MHPCRTGKPPL